MLLSYDAGNFSVNRKIRIKKWWNVLRTVSALTFEPYLQIENRIQQIKQTFSPNWSKFFAYFVNTWTKRFPPELWNVEFLEKTTNESIICRTNNILERYNRKLNENLSAHGNIISLVEFLKSEHLYFRSILTSARDGDIQRGNIEPVSSEPILIELLEKLKSRNKPLISPKKNQEWLKKILPIRNARKRKVNRKKKDQKKTKHLKLQPNPP